MYVSCQSIVLECFVCVLCIFCFVGVGVPADGRRGGRRSVDDRRRQLDSERHEAAAFSPRRILTRDSSNFVCIGNFSKRARAHSSVVLRFVNISSRVVK